MNLIFVIFALFCFTFCGYLILNLLKIFKDKSEIEKIPFSFGLGAGIIAFQLYLYSRLNISLDLLYILLPWLFLFLYSFYKKSLKFKINKFNFDFVSKIFLTFIILLILFVAFESILRPVMAFDGFASWLFRSKIFFIENGVHVRTFNYLTSEYPEIVSLMSVFIYKIFGEIDDRFVLLLYPGFYISIAILFYYSIVKKQSTKVALFFTFLLISTQNIIRHSGRFEAGQADIILGFYIFASSLIFLDFIKNKKIEYLILLQLFLAITSLVKNDGVPFVIFMQLMIIVFLIKNKLAKYFLVILIWLVPFLEWQYFKSILNIPKLPPYFDFKIQLDRTFLILQKFFEEMLNLKNWNFIWITFFISFLIFIFYYRKNHKIMILYSIIIFQLLIYAGIFFFTLPDPNLHIPNVLNRSLLHLAPLAVYVIALIFNEINRDKNNSY